MLEINVAKFHKRHVITINHLSCVTASSCGLICYVLDSIRSSNISFLYQRLISGKLFCCHQGKLDLVPTTSEIQQQTRSKYISLINQTNMIQHTILKKWQYASRYLQSFIILVLITELTHWGRDKTAASFKTTISNAFSWMNMYKFRLRFHWSLCPRVQLIIFQPNRREAIVWVNDISHSAWMS